MEVYIDNVKIEMKQKSFKSLGRVISEINKKLKRENKILQEIYVNGDSIKENLILRGEDLKVIEVTTKSHGSVILESLRESKKYIERFFDAFDNMGEGDEYSVIEDELKAVEMIAFVKWFYNLLLIIQENHIFDFIYDDFDDFLDDFRMVVEEVEKAFDAGDFDGFLNVLEYAVGDLLGQFFENLEEFYSDVVEDENRKRLLN